MKRFVIILMVFALAALLIPAGILAEETSTPPTDTEVEKKVVAANIVEAFPELGLTVEQIEAYKASGWGYGEMVIAASLASKSGKTVDEILAMYESGQGWGEIAKSLGIQPGKLGQIISGIVSNGKHHRKGKTSSAAAEETASAELTRLNFGQSKKAQDGLKAQYKVTHRELLTACAVARASGDKQALKTALEMRKQGQKWQDVMRQLKVDLKGATTQGKGKAKAKNGKGNGSSGQETGHGSGSGNGKP